MAKDNPYSTGIFETIIGVHFGGGLAVEFKPDGFPVSYLTERTALTGLNKGTISLWFRVPSSSFQKLRPKGVLPILSFGPVYHWRYYNQNVRDAGVGFPRHLEIDTDGDGIIDALGPAAYIPSAAGVAKTVQSEETSDPGYIGVRKAENGSMNLVFNFQTGQRPVFAYYDMQVTSVRYIPPTLDGVVGNPEYALGIDLIPPALASPGSPRYGSGYDLYGSNADLGFASGVVDVQPLPDEGPPERYLVESVVPLTTDHWHHLLVSFDFSDCRTHGNLDPFIDYRQSVAQGTAHSGKLYYAIDTVDYRGEQHMQPYFVGNDETGGRGGGTPVEFGPNDILTVNGYSISTILTNYPFNLAFNPTTYAFQPATMFPNGFGVPASKSFSDHIQKIEMSELQLFKQVVDTSSAAIKALFVDKDGKPVTDYTAVDRQLGKPVVRLHGSSKWIKGVNLGSSGDLTPTNKIIKYVPDPSLHGDQGKPN